MAGINRRNMLFGSAAAGGMLAARHVGRGRRTSRKSLFISARTRAAGSEP